MSEWLPFVGLAKYVKYKEDNRWFATNAKSEYRPFTYSEGNNDVIFQRATNVSASVSKVDDFSYRFTVRFRHLEPDCVIGSLQHEDYAIFLAKGTRNPNFFFETTEQKAEPDNYENLCCRLYLFGYPGMYNNITVKQVEGIFPLLYDVEYSGVQIIRECATETRIPIEEICQ